MRKLTTTLVGLAVMTAMGHAQDQAAMNAVKPPAEMKQLAGMIGTWKGTMHFYWGPKPSSCVGTMVYTSELNGRYIMGKASYTEPTMGPQSGIMLLTYDAGKSKWVMTWFDSVGAQTMKAYGTKSGNQTVFETDWEKDEATGSSARTKFRETITMINSNRFSFVLEMMPETEGAKWTKFLETTYDRVVKKSTRTKKR